MTNMDSIKKLIATSEPSLYVKVGIVLFIVLATFYNVGKHLSFLDNKVSKLLLLAVVIGTIIADLHTGIILLIAFMMLMIQFNSIIVDDIRHKEMELFLTSRPAPLNADEEVAEEDETGFKVIPDSKEAAAGVQCDNIKKNEISCNILKVSTDPQSNADYALDSKVKPYEVFVKMMTSQEHLDKASNSAFWQ